MHRKGNFLICGGLLLLAAALCTGVYHLWDEARAQNSTEQLVQQLEAQLAQPAPAEAGAANAASGTLPQDGPTPVVQLDGNAYIGVLELPAIGVTVPVMRDWSYPRLWLSPCRFAGSADGDDLVIAGHNYAAHFARLKQLRAGDAVVFTDAAGRSICYTVQAQILLDPQQPDALDGGDWDLTLFTCTADGARRVGVQCKRAAG